MTIRDQRLFGAGILFVAFGVLTLVQVPGYRLGTATHMGPGYFPMLVAILLVALGALAAWLGLRAPVEAKIGRWPLAPTVFVTAGVLMFSVLIERAGLVVSVLCLVALACYERLVRRPLEVALIAAVVVALTAGVFIYGIGLPIALW